MVGVCASRRRDPDDDLGDRTTGRARAQHNHMIATGVREELFRVRAGFEQHSAQALKHMMTQFENQKHVEVKREASE